jgi:hypothetical protein
LTHEPTGECGRVTRQSDPGVAKDKKLASSLFFAKPP